MRGRCRKYGRRNCHHSYRGLTLVELLAVIAIIAILAAILLPAIAGARKRVKSSACRWREAELAQAVESYLRTYGQPPVTRAAASNAVFFGNSGGDATCGWGQNADGARCEDVGAALADLDAGPNAGHAKNPLRVKFAEGAEPGGALLDPWGNRFVFAFDSNADGYTVEATYGVPEAAGTNVPGLFAWRSPAGRTWNASHLAVLVWSCGPDGKSTPLRKWNQGENRDNVLSWDGRL